MSIVLQLSSIIENDGVIDGAYCHEFHRLQTRNNLDGDAVVSSLSSLAHGCGFVSFVNCLYGDACGVFSSCGQNPMNHYTAICSCDHHFGYHFLCLVSRHEHDLDLDCDFDCRHEDGDFHFCCHCHSQIVDCDISHLHLEIGRLDQSCQIQNHLLFCCHLLVVVAVVAAVLCYRIRIDLANCDLGHCF